MPRSLSAPACASIDANFSTGARSMVVYGGLIWGVRIHCLRATLGRENRRWWTPSPRCFCQPRESPTTRLQEQK